MTVSFPQYSVNLLGGLNSTRKLHGSSLDDRLDNKVHFSASVGVEFDLNPIKFGICYNDKKIFYDFIGVIAECPDGFFDMGIVSEEYRFITYYGLIPFFYHHRLSPFTGFEIDKFQSGHEFFQTIDPESIRLQYGYLFGFDYKITSFIVLRLSYYISVTPLEARYNLNNRLNTFQILFNIHLLDFSRHNK